MVNDNIVEQIHRIISGGSCLTMLSNGGRLRTEFTLASPYILDESTLDWFDVTGDLYYYGHNFHVLRFHRCISDGDNRVLFIGEGGDKLAYLETVTEADSGEVGQQTLYWEQWLKIQSAPSTVEFRNELFDDDKIRAYMQELHRYHQEQGK